MSRTRPELSDAHNFGRRVELRAGRVVKPRTIFWEWLVLAADSPLRRALNAAVQTEGWPEGTFEFLPSLRFFEARSGIGGEVQRVKLEPLPALSSEHKGELARIVGRSLALWSWLGVADLHWENLVLGRDRRRRVIFGPLDVELMLADLSSPTETKLLPDADPEYALVCQHAAGVRRVLPYLGKPIRQPDLVAMVAAYRATLELLDRHAPALASVLAKLPLGQEPLRVLLRGTEQYVRGDTETLWPPLLDAEREQLARGDVPYFFRLYGRQGLHYFADASLERVKRLPLRGDVPQLDTLLDVKRGLRAPSRKTLREDGIFTLLGAFDHPSFAGKQQSDGLQVTFGARSLTVRLPDGSELRSRRDLRAFVSSVYLPCRCGEVRSVFVPQLTRCGSRRSAV